MTPGSRALAFATRWFDPQTVTTVFEPLVADWRREWLDAAPARRPQIQARGITAVVCSVILLSPRLFRPVRGPLTAQTIRRTAIYMVVACAVLSLKTLGGLETPWSPSLLIYLMCSVGTLALPFSTVIGADAILRHDHLPAHTQRRAVLQLVTFTLLFLLVSSAWIVPAAQALWLSTDANAVTSATGLRSETDHAGRATGALLGLLPPLLLWVRLRSSDVPHRRHGLFAAEPPPFESPMPTSLAVTLATLGYASMYLAIGTAGMWWSLPLGGTVWLPALAIVIAGTPELWRSRLRTRRS